MISRRVRISDDSLNSYKARVLTSSMNAEQYCRSPVLLYMHERGNVIGYVKGMKVEGGGVTGGLVFDETTELSRRCKRQFEFGNLKMVGAGLDIIEMSEDSAYLVVGQTSPTITGSKLFEVSVVNIGTSDDALVLRENDKRIALGRDGECPLPELNSNNQKTGNEMENKAIALQLGLSETATDAEIAEKIGEFRTVKEESKSLQKEKDELTLASTTSLMEKAIGERHITADEKNEFISLGKEIGVGKLISIFSAMSPQVKLSAVLNQRGTTKTDVPATYEKLNEVPGDRLLETYEQQSDEYKWLYKTEYGVEYGI